MGVLLKSDPTSLETALAAGAAGALGVFAETGLPHRRMEAWKWTDLRAALREPPETGADNDLIAPSVFADLEPFEILIMNGAADWRGAPPQGVAIEARPFELNAPIADHPLANLCAASVETSVSIKIAAGVAVDRPILLRRVAGATLSHDAVTIVVEERAQATVIESLDARGPGFVNSVVRIEIEKDAALTRLMMQDGAEDGVDVNVAGARLAANATINQTGLLLGARASRAELRAALVGEGAQANIAGVSMLSAARHADMTTHLVFDAPGCAATQVHKSALADKGHGVFQGKFLVNRAAQKTDARMSVDALLLSDAAEASHKPELEIYADDVECAHGSTAGALDDDALFYMRQRGLSRDAARAALIEAFAMEAIDTIDDVSARSIFAARLRHVLGASE